MFQHSHHVKRRPRGLAQWVLGLIIMTVAGSAVAGICRVDHDATGNNDGSSWADAYTQLQDALIDHDCTEIWVAEGVYTPDPDPRASFIINRELQLYGGFSGHETQRSERDSDAHVTILSGDIGGDDINTDGNYIAETWQQIRNQNSYHVVLIDGVLQPITASTVVDGFVITAGTANGTYLNLSGGGMICDGAGAGSQCAPTLRNLLFSGNKAKSTAGALANYGEWGGNSSPQLMDVTFKNNYARDGGGAVVNAGNHDGVSSPRFENVLFIGNRSDNGGGAMYNAAAGGESIPQLVNVRFEDNHAGMGGALYNLASSDGVAAPQLTDVSFVSNSAYSHGGAVYLSCFNLSPKPAFHRVVFRDNAAGDDGGGVHGMSIISDLCAPEFVDVIFDGNTAGRNGGAMSFDSMAGRNKPKLRGVTFSNNSASNTGGALMLMGQLGGFTDTTLTNVTFSGNSAVKSGGAMASITILGSNRVELVNVTMVHNSAQSDGGGIVSMFTSLKLRNVILWGNDALGTGQQLNNGGSASVTVHDSILEGGCSAIAGSGNITSCTDIITIAPNLGPLQDNGGFTETRYPQSGSPAIDAADDSVCPATDQRGVSRPAGAACDIGAVEAVRMYELAVGVLGEGEVSAQTPPIPLTGGITNCTSTGGQCSANYVDQPVVTLDATPATGWHFYMWGVDCGGAGTSPSATVTMDQNRGCMATFRINQHLVGGTVTGLVGSGLELSLNGGAQTLPITADGSFSFPTPLDYAAAYSVTVATQPSGPAQTCTVANGSDVMPDADVSNVQVTCSTASHTVTGVVASGQGSIMPGTQTVANMGTATLTVTPDAGWHVDAVSGCGGSLAGTTYTTDPVTADCTVTATFAPNLHTVGGTVAGLAAGNSVVLQNNGGDNLTVSADGSFQFATPVPYGQPWAVTVLMQPTTPAQTCTVANGTGSMPDADVTNVIVTCATGTHTVTASVAGGQGSIAPPTQTIADGGSASFTVTPDTGWHVAAISGDTCTVTGAGSSYSVANVTADCAVTVRFAIDTFAINGTVVSGNGSITPATASAAYGEVLTFTLTPDANWQIDSVTGCGGTLSGNTYTTAPIVAPCTIQVGFASIVQASTPVPALDWRGLLALIGLLGILAIVATRRSPL